MSLDDWERLFDAAVSSVFRLETLPAYSIAENADLAGRRRGGPTAGGAPS